MPDTGIIYYPRGGERVTAHIAPAAKAPWDVLTADVARAMSEALAHYAAFWIEATWADALRAYADAVDAMTQPARIEYETEEA